MTVLTGAGISTESGIPDFRGPNGVWTKNPAAEKTATLQYYMSDPAVRRQAWQNRVNGEMWAAEPNAAHRALVELEHKGKLQTLVTQNIDGLHHAAGQSPEIVVEIHGNVREAKCMGCDWRAPMHEALERVRGRRGRPRLPRLRRHPEVGDDQLRREPRRGRPAPRPDRGRHAPTCSSRSARRSRSTPPPALPEIARRNGARLVILNAEETPFDPVADAVVRDQLGEVLPVLVDLV